jgi:hypothetical protein
MRSTINLYYALSNEIDRHAKSGDLLPRQAMDAAVALLASTAMRIKLPSSDYKEYKKSVLHIVDVAMDETESIFSQRKN